MKPPIAIKVAIWIAFLLVGWLLLSCCDRIARGKIVISADPYDSSVLLYNQHRWFWKNEAIELKARRNEHGEWVWMACRTNGEWYPFFREKFE